MQHLWPYPCDISASHLTRHGSDDLGEERGFQPGEQSTINGRRKMNWDQIEGKWSQFKGSIKQQWGKITDDDLDYIAGTRDKFVGKLQERYGLAKEDAQRKADEWATAQADKRTA